MTVGYNSSAIDRRWQPRNWAIARTPPDKIHRAIAWVKEMKDNKEDDDDDQQQHVKEKIIVFTVSRLQTQIMEEEIVCNRW